MSVDPLGCVGDGGAAEFELAMLDRISLADRERAEALDERAMHGEGSVDEALESLRLVWPAYFADPASAPAMPEIRMSLDGYAETWASLQAGLPGLEAPLPSIAIPVHFVHGGRVRCRSARAPRRRPGSLGPRWNVVEGAGHFIWHERPGAVRSLSTDASHASAG